MYEPREDSFLLLKHLKKYIKSEDKILDMGTGSGILAKEASKYGRAVVACDINDKIAKELSKEQENQKITFIHSDLFSNIKNVRFDLIVFNPPYLPSRSVIHEDTDGGKGGVEIITKFLEQAKAYLQRKGKILLLCSSYNKNITRLFKKYKYNFRKIDETSLFFEKLYVYELK